MDSTREPHATILAARRCPGQAR